MDITAVESEREIERLETPSKIIKERRDNRQTRDSLMLTSTVASPFVPCCNCLQLIPACGQLNMPRLGCVTVAILFCRCARIDQLGSSHPLDPSSPACSALLCSAGGVSL